MALIQVANKNIFQYNRVPTTADSGYPVGSIWIPTNKDGVYFLLTSNIGGIATWVENLGTFGPGNLILKGTIAVNTEFPLLADVQSGWVYSVTQNVTDNAAGGRTNTGQSFLAGVQIVWNGTNWSELGTNALWGDNGTDLTPISPGRNINLGTGLLKDEHTVTGTALAQVTDASLDPDFGEEGAFSLLGASNNLLERSRRLSVGVHTFPTISDLGTGSFTVGDNGVYNINTETDYSGFIRQYSLIGDTFTPADGVITYLIANYAAGTPEIQTTINAAVINNSSVIKIATIYRSGTTLDILREDTAAIGLNNKLKDSGDGIRIVSGIVLTESAGNVVKFSEGSLYYKTRLVSSAEFASDVNTMYIHYHTAGNWTKTPVTAYNNLDYDNGTNKVALTLNRYTINWVYKEFGANIVHLVLGQGDYLIGEASIAQPPLELPEKLSTHCFLAGRIIVKSGALTAFTKSSLSDVVFNNNGGEGGAGEEDHNDLLGLQGGTFNEYYHLDFAQYNAVNNAPVIKCRVATTANLVISTSLNVGDVLDGITLADKDLVFVWQQADQAENGIYVAGAIPARLSSYASDDSIRGSRIIVKEGARYSGFEFRNLNTEPITINVTHLRFLETDNILANAQHVYVSKSTGSDLTGDGSVANPYQTIEKAFYNMPQFFRSSYIHLKADSYTVSAQLESLINNKAQSHTRYAMFLQPWDGEEYTSIDSGTMTSSNYFSHSDNTKTWTVDEHKGRFLKNTVSGEVYPISHNTVTEIFHAGSSTYWIDDITTYEILDLATTITFTQPISYGGRLVSLLMLYSKIIEATSIEATQGNLGFFGCNVSCATINVSPNKEYGTCIYKSFLDLTSGTDRNLGSVALSVITSDVGVVTDSVNSSLIRPRTAGQKNTSAVTSMDMLNSFYVFDNYIKDFKYGYKIPNNITSTSNIVTCLADHFEYDNVNFAFYGAPGLQIVSDNTFPVYDLGIPLTGQLTFDGVNAYTTYINVRDNVYCPVLGTTGVFLDRYSTGVSSGTEVINSFPDLLAGSCRWDVEVRKGLAYRMFSIHAIWDAASNAINDSGEYGLCGAGDTSDVVITVDIDSNNVRLVSTAASNGWTITLGRYLV